MARADQPRDLLLTAPAPLGMRSIAEHLAAVLALAEPTPVTDVPVDAAHGLVLAADVAAADDLPRWDNSAMDGYAVRAADVAGASPDAPVHRDVVGDLPAGSDAEPHVTDGVVARIMTGAPVPPGADAIVPVEHTDAGLHRVRIDRAPEPGAHIRRRGDDVRAGDVVLTAGAPLGPAHVAAAASVGAATLAVHRRPRVVVVSTGSELVAPGRPLARGQIPDSNSILLAAAVEAAGCEAIRVGAVPDDPETLRAVLAEHDGGPRPADVVVTSGGVSVGAYDVVKAALTGWGDVGFVRVAMQPGKPQGLGRLPGGTPVLCLPGNPVSAHVSFEVFVRPALLLLRGHHGPDPARPVVQAVVDDGWRTPPGRAQLMPVRLTERDGVLHARRSAPGGSGSHLVAGLAASDGLAEVAVDVEAVEPGTPLPVRRTRP